MPFPGISTRTSRFLSHGARRGWVALMAAAGLVQPAQAMNVSTDQLGQVLLFPYYTVKGGFDTVITVTNVSDSTTVIRVRFREALNGREVAAFNVVMPPGDVWSGATTMNATGDGAVLRTYDNSCTVPQFPASATAVPAREIAFSNASYTDTPPHASDGAGTALNRVQEGYFEVIAMGRFAAGAQTNAAMVVPYNAQHTAVGVPLSCANVAAAGAEAYTALLPPANKLFGAAILISVPRGQAIDAPPVAIAGFADFAPIWYPPTSPHPDLADGDGAEAARYTAGGRRRIDAIATNSADTISALLMADEVVNDYASDGIGALTNWVVTFPTKRHYVDRPTALPPFHQPFADAGQSCVASGITYSNRESLTFPEVSPTAIPSPSLPPAYPFCYASNVVTFNGATLFGEGANRVPLVTTPSGTAGWARIRFGNAGQNINGNTVSTGAYGFPVIGFAAIVRNNASEAGNNRNYGSTSLPTHVRY